MAAAALALALAAAFLHAFWNVVLARSKDAEAATAVALAVSAVVFAPVAAVTWDIRWEAAPYLAASSALELAYFALLAGAYRRAELSVVYPLARGLSPVLVLFFAVTALDAKTSASQAIGVLLVAVGVMLVRGLRTSEGQGAAFGVAIALCIAGYTIVDKEGIRHGDPIAYLELRGLGPTVVYFAAVIAVKGRAAVRAEVNAPILLAALAMFGAYGLVLAALELAPAAPVAAVRETSVVIATVLAAVVLRETVRPARLLGSVAVVGGIALVAA